MKAYRALADLPRGRVVPAVAAAHRRERDPEPVPHVEPPAGARAHRRGSRSLFAPIGDAADPAETAIDRERRQALWAALLTLPAAQRTVLTCRYLLDLDEAETAAVLGIARGTVKSRSNRGLRSLRACLAGRAMRPKGVRQMAERDADIEALESELRGLGRVLAIAPPPDGLVEAVMTRLEREPIAGRRGVVAASCSTAASAAGRWLRERWRIGTAVLAGALLVLLRSRPAGAAVRQWLGFGAVVVVQEQAPPTSAAPPPSARPHCTGPDGTEMSVAQARAAVPFPVGVPASLGPPTLVTVSGDARVVSMTWSGRRDDDPARPDRRRRRSVLRQEVLLRHRIHPGAWPRGAVADPAASDRGARPRRHGAGRIRAAIRSGAALAELGGHAAAGRRGRPGAGSVDRRIRGALTRAMEPADRVSGVTCAMKALPAMKGPMRPRPRRFAMRTECAHAGWFGFCSRCSSHRRVAW